jgi:hypothetical protein
MQLKNSRDRKFTLKTQSTFQEFQERERAQKRRKAEQEDPWHISSGKHRRHSTMVTHVPIGFR